jgi:hypothetical protein
VPATRARTAAPTLAAPTLSRQADFFVLSMVSPVVMLSQSSDPRRIRTTSRT